MPKSISRTLSVSWFSLPALIVWSCISLMPETSEAASDERTDEDSVELGSTRLIRYTVDNNFKVRGWKLSPEIYFGNAKINGEWGVGLLVDKGDYAYGFNNTQASFMWRF